MALFGQVATALGAEVPPDALFGTLLPLASQGEPDAGGLLSINYVSGEHITGFTEGRPLFARNQDSRFTLPNFLRAMYYASLCAVRTGMDILTGGGGGHRGDPRPRRLLQGRRHRAAHDGRGPQRARSASPATAGEGGAWGMAVLAAYMLRDDANQSLPDYLDERIGTSIEQPFEARPARRGRVRCILRAPQARAGR